MMEILTTNSIQLNFKQKEALENGMKKRERMRLLIENITQLHQSEKYSNLYIYSPPGLGKTHMVTEYLKISNIKFYPVSGNTSMFAFGIQLAVIQYNNQDMSPIIIYVDDCDEIFKNDQNCNTMKKVLDADKKFVYEKSLSSQWNNMGQEQRDAITYFREEGKMGFEFPTYNMRFIFTSNFQLPFEDDVAEARRKSKSKSVLLSHMYAIRSRCKVADYNLKADEHWGWIANVILEEDCLNEFDVSLEEKEVLLKFIWDNWSYLTERSIRLVEKMTITMRIFPETYEQVWQIDFIKNN